MNRKFTRYEYSDAIRPKLIKGLCDAKLQHLLIAQCAARGTASLWALAAEHPRSYANAKPIALNVDLPLRFQVQRMRVLLSFGHGEIQCLLGGDRLPVLVVERPTLPVDVDVPACLHVPIALDGAALLLPGELLGLMGG